MRKRRNGFTKFMSRLDGKSGVSRKVDTSDFTIPEDLSVPAVIRVLDDLESRGDTCNLTSCFAWRSSPQGFDYWCDIYEGQTVIDREGLNYLYWLLEQET